MAQSEQLTNYLSLARLMGIAGNAEAARQALDRALELYSGIASPVRLEGMLLVEKLAEEHRFDEAQALARKLSSGFERDLSYITIAQQLAKTGDVAGAEAAAAKLGPEQPETKLANHRTVYATIAAAQIRAGDKAAARATLATNQVVNDETLSSALLQAGDIAGAVDAASHVTDPAVKASLLWDAADARVKQGNRAAAADLLDATETAAAEIADPRPQLYTMMALSRAEIGDRVGSRRDFGLARENIKKTSGVRALFASSNVATSEAEAGNTQEALEVLHGMQVPPEGPDSSSSDRDEALVEVAKVQASLGDLSAARQSLAKRKYARIATHDITEIAGEVAWAGKYSDLKEWARTLDRPEDRFGIYLGTAEAILARKDMVKRGVLPATSPTSRP